MRAQRSCPEQLQAIEAGAAFRSLAEAHGAVEITEIRRQRDDWQRGATRALATGRTGEAMPVLAIDIWQVGILGSSKLHR